MPAQRRCPKCWRLTAAGSHCRNCKRWPSSPGRLRGRRNQELRAKMLAIYAHRCGACGATGVPLELHHRDHEHRNNAPTNLIVLCKPCHARASLRLF